MWQVPHQAFKFVFEVDGVLRAAMDEVYARIPAHSMVTFHDMQTVSANTGLMGRAANIAEGVGAKIAAAVGLTEGRLSSRAVDPLPLLLTGCAPGRPSQRSVPKEAEGTGPGG